MSANNKTYKPLGTFTIKAGEDILPKRFIGFDGKYSSAQSKSLGVSESKWLSGEFASVITIGTAIVETSGAIDTGDALTADTGGKAKKATSAMPVNGRSLDKVTGAGFIRVLLVQ